ncbi:hypothetical protein [Limosilactobacillus fastidiosus]|uniref:Uncharacterized protein n=1 Tax=Limosilactobacillus fastidiosus TaxID=2759855 RepID=A0A7W3YBF3_9LACO|nr:hypothetical protein [Limosilactobacillus fastidiosus]MBB1062869.1 hypothetical protein [Limosilactobacillus fastidiosus]MBB1085218.1 hypothetical protein [Limosilactobacillus fastidiosus]MCD7084430.1 hypothetical protein [Limosilactobacillus fastidiosus]MCD7084973.1 hypothetical protein [Limosilactobacillus fastidiosus]MCD7113725.1 hypothetical protein [Limosilactobacillus fastidiosus]
MDGMIDISRLGELKKYLVTNGFQPRWDNVLLLTAYDREQTYVLTVDGEEYVLPKRLKDALHDFSKWANVHRIEMQTLYSIVGGRTPGIIAGHYELVPTCGQGNSRVAYYMAHSMDNYQPSQDNNGVLLTFKGTNQQLITVMIDACVKTFERHLKQAHAVGQIQLESVKNLCNRFGIGEQELNHLSCTTTYHERYLHRKQYEKVFLEQILKGVKQTADKCYGEDLTAEFYAQLRRTLTLY